MLDALDVNPITGISSADLEARDKVFGSNYKEPLKRTPFFTMLLAALDDFMLKILMICAVFSMIVDVLLADPHERSHAWVEGFAILVAVAVVSNVSAWSDYKKEGQFLKQQQLEENSKIVS